MAQKDSLRGGGSLEHPAKRIKKERPGSDASTACPLSISATTLVHPRSGFLMAVPSWRANRRLAAVLSAVITKPSRGAPRWTSLA